MPIREMPAPRSSGPPRMLFVLVGLFTLLFFARSIAQLVIEYEWWREMGQVETWQSIILYSFAPVALATLLAFIVLWTVHARALKFARTGLGEHRIYARISTLVL